MVHLILGKPGEIDIDSELFGEAPTLGLEATIDEHDDG